jgi:hypothetical protein
VWQASSLIRKEEERRVVAPQYLAKPCPAQFVRTNAHHCQRR